MVMSIVVFFFRTIYSQTELVLKCILAPLRRNFEPSVAVSVIITGGNKSTVPYAYFLSNYGFLHAETVLKLKFRRICGLDTTRRMHLVFETAGVARVTRVSFAS